MNDVTTDRRAEQRLDGIGVSPGMAVGGAVRYLPAAAVRRAIAPADVPREQEQLRQAIVRARARLDDLAAQVARDLDGAQAGIFTAQALMLADPAIADRAADLIAANLSDAASSVLEAGETEAAALARLPDATLSGRAADVRDAVRRVAHEVRGDDGASLARLVARATPPVIIVARDLAPSETAQLRPDQVAGLCLALGGPTAHAAILARTLGIPAVAGLGEELLATVAEGEPLGVDADAGAVFVRPAAATRERLAAGAAQVRQTRAQAREAARQWRTRPGMTADGWRVVVAANVGSVEDALAAGATWGAEAIGLLRTEFFFDGRATLPDEDEQAERYARCFAAFADRQQPERPVVARTLDAGADKPIPALSALMPHEENPALGVRGLRLHLAHPDLLRVQVRALLRAAGATRTPLHIMFPMVATVEEVRRARIIMQSAWRELQAAGQPIPAEVPLGIMVETPAAAVMASALAREVEFFSLGTNDLTQYVMAGDRLNANVAALYHPLQPAVLQLIARTARAGQIAGRPVAVCGEMAATPAYAALLAGLGVTELSMNAPAIPAVKAQLAAARYAQLRAWADHILTLPTLEDVQAFVARGVPEG